MLQWNSVKFCFSDKLCSHADIVGQLDHTLSNKALHHRFARDGPISSAFTSPRNLLPVQILWPHWLNHKLWEWQQFLFNKNFRSFWFMMMSENHNSMTCYEWYITSDILWMHHRTARWKQGTVGIGRDNSSLRQSVSVDVMRRRWTVDMFSRQSQ